MCGIFGHFSTNLSTTPSASHVLSALKHRGPDGEGWVTFDHGVMGHTRLSIIDLSRHADQPMTTPNKRLTIAFNGEIYNYKALRKSLMDQGVSLATTSDTEVVLQGFAVWGNGIFQKLDGMFAIAIYDRENHTLTLARDGLGIKPLLYRQDTGSFSFASELRPFMKGLLGQPTISLQAINTLLKTGSVTQPLTILQDVFSFPPGHFLTFSIKEDSHQLRRVTPPNEGLQQPPMEYEAAVRSLRVHLEDATARHLTSDVEVGCFLSAGIDSAAVLGLAQTQLTHPIPTFTLGFKGDPATHPDEVTAARKTAQYHGAEFHHTRISSEDALLSFDSFIDAVDQPSIDGFNTFLISKFVQNRCKVVLTGLGADELFAGYRHFRVYAQALKKRLPYITNLGKIAYRLRPTRWTQHYAYADYSALDMSTAFRTVFRVPPLAESINQPSNLTTRDHFTFPNLETDSSSGTALQQLCIAEQRTYLLNTLLRDTDAVSMWHAIEVRPLLLDNHIVAFARTQPDHYLVRHGRGKAIFRDAVKDLIPPSLTRRPKTGFELPLAQWVGGCLRTRAEAMLTSRWAKRLFSHAYLTERRIAVRNAHASRQDWLLLVLLSWLEKANIDL